MKKWVNSFLGLFVAYPLTRRQVNRLYMRLSATQRKRFHRLFAKVFRRSFVRGRPGIWLVAFAGQQLQMPLGRETLALDWASAVSITGHDLEVKLTYEALISTASERPDCFIDIGANYGTHSLLFLVHGIRTLTFEPNRSCHLYFKRACELNSLTPDLRHLAVGSLPSVVELQYPKEETWLGSTDPNVASLLAANREMVTEQVEQVTLDQITLPDTGPRLLIKIDTEGNELSVLQGMVELMRNRSPRIIFECIPEQAERQKLFDLFAMQGYRIHSLPWRPESRSLPLTSTGYLAHRQHNFIALPGGDK